MSVEIKGMDEVLAKLEQKVGQRARDKAERAALDAGGDAVKGMVKDAVASYRDTGATFEEVVVGKAHKVGGRIVIRVGWNGPKQRYRLVHLNEFGYTRFGRHYSPRGMGKVQSAYDASKGVYLKIAKAELEARLVGR